ncbi:hypothetical protein BC940DRAFT_301401 [Gongronella butleri]|nr:hypothetical protein BC940DRAFT_301401 [Gongronella butleri]
MGASLSRQEDRMNELLEPHDLYAHLPIDYKRKLVRKLILTKRLAPFHEGNDAAKSEQDTECPICFLHYSSAINESKCCHQPICTECFVQMKRMDPAVAVACPFCCSAGFGVCYSQGTKTHAAADLSCSPASDDAPCATPSPTPTSSATSTTSFLRRKRFAVHPIPKAKDIPIVLVDDIRPPPPARLTGVVQPGPLYYAADLPMGRIGTSSFEDLLVELAMQRANRERPLRGESSAQSADSPLVAPTATYSIFFTTSAPNTSNPSSTGAAY